MRKKTNSSIYHVQNYTQLQKVKYILTTCFKNDELTSWAKKSGHSI